LDPQLALARFVVVALIVTDRSIDPRARRRRIRAAADDAPPDRNFLVHYYSDPGVC